MIPISKSYTQSQYVCELYINLRLRQFVTLTLTRCCGKANQYENYAQMLHMNIRHKTPTEENVRLTPTEGNVRLTPASGN
jgi:hypothetical protein